MIWSFGKKKIRKKRGLIVRAHFEGGSCWYPKCRLWVGGQYPPVGSDARPLRRTSILRGDSPHRLFELLRLINTGQSHRLTSAKDISGHSVVMGRVNILSEAVATLPYRKGQAI